MERAFLDMSHTPLMALNPLAAPVEQELRAAIAGFGVKLLNQPN